MNWGSKNKHDVLCKIHRIRTQRGCSSGRLLSIRVKSYTTVRSSAAVNSLRRCAGQTPTFTVADQQLQIAAGATVKGSIGRQAPNRAHFVSLLLRQLRKAWRAKPSLLTVSCGSGPSRWRP
jgi:hypothetical protein